MAFNLLEEVNKKLADTSISQSKDMPELPPEISSFLGNLGLLKGIPSHYFVPNEFYLPKTLLTDKTEPMEQGSLKMFCLDKDWIEALVDGALSICETDTLSLTGKKTNYRKILLDKAMAGNYVAEVFYQDSKEQIKQQLYGLYSPSEFEKELNARIALKNINLSTNENGKRCAMPTVAQANWCYTGFFMRSVLISAWSGVEITAKGKNGYNSDEAIRPLQVLRLEKLADDILFCICEGYISLIEIKQPQEGLHFTNENNSKIPVNKNGVARFGNMANKPANSVKFAQELIAKPLIVTLNVTWK